MQGTKGEFGDNMSHKNFENENLKQMEMVLDTFFKSNKIDYSVPFDIVHLAKKLGFIIYPRKLDPNIDGIIYVDENVDRVKGFPCNKILAYNVTRGLTHIRFIIAHELAHYIEEKSKNPNQKIVFAAREHSSAEKSIEEQKMDYMAAAILIPQKMIYQDILPYIENNNFTDDMSKITSILAKKYNVGPIVVLRRIEEILDESAN